MVAEASYGRAGGIYAADLTMVNGKDAATDVAPLYEKDYFVIVKLPNIIQERTNESLIFTFTIGENVFTYNARE